MIRHKTRHVAFAVYTSAKHSQSYLMIDDLIESIRKNPGAYAQTQLQNQTSSLNDLDLEQLVASLFASANFDKQALFKQLDKAIKKHPQPLTPPLQFHYQIAKGLYSRSLSQINDAIKHFSLAYNEAIALNQGQYLARTFIYLATCFDQLGENQTNKEYLLKAVKLVPELTDNALISNIYMAYGHLSSRENNGADCLNAFMLAKQYYDLVSDKDQHLNYSVLLLNLGRYHIINRDLELARPYVDAGLKIVQEHNFFIFVQRSLKTIADLYTGQGELAKANQMLSIFVDQQQQTLSARESQLIKKQSRPVLQRLHQLHQLQDRNQQLQNELANMQRLLNNDALSPDQEQLLRIKKAVKNQEFVPFYQAKQDLGDGKIVGFELLCRWQQGETYLSPNHFIEHIENNNLVIQFSEQLFRQGFQDLALLISQGHPKYHLSLNISPFQLSHQDLGTLLSSLCVEFGISTSQIEVEVVERTFLENNPKAIKQLYALRELGFRISLDDFGSGYSSLACLIELPLDCVKIDRSLAQNLEQSDRATRLFNNIANLLHDFQLEIVVEGIETEAQLACAKAQRCQQMQGFLWHKPCTFANLLNWLDNR